LLMDAGKVGLLVSLHRMAHEVVLNIHAAPLAQVSRRMLGSI
jgi:hypothetical protein